MDDPIKIIFRYKNNSRRVQHHIYIFIGEVPSAVRSVLNKITDLSLYETWSQISKPDLSKLEKHYGEEWWKKFFNTYHLNFTISSIRNTQEFQKELIDKFGKEWYNKAILQHELIDRKIFYTYEATIKDEKTRQEMRKKKIVLAEDDEDIDYTTKKKRGFDVFTGNKPLQISRQTNISQDLPLDTLSGENIIADGSYNPSAYEFSHFMHVLQSGGSEAEGYSDEALEEMTDLADEDDDGVIEFSEGLDQNQTFEEEEMDIEEMEKVYQDTDVQVDEHVSKTSDLIKKALKDDNIFKKTESKLIRFDTSKDDIMYDEQLKDVYKKHYVSTQYIFKDDTVKMTKNKICCAILNNEKFGKEQKIIPSRQHLWSEYYFNGMVENVMIGQKWIKRTEMLNIDVEPNNNIRIYEELRNNLKILRDNIKRYGSKIKREDDDFNILFDYERYITNNEIFMIDVYNELGKGYDPSEEAIRNLSDVYFRIYFPRIKQEDIKYIFSYVANDPNVERNKISTIFETINNDLIMENHVMRDVEATKKIKGYTDIFKDNYITQSVIHVNLRVENNKKIDLFRIFNEFVMTQKYPFIQYQTLDGQIIFKYDEADISSYASQKENLDILTKWFENAPYGISFKVRVKERGIEKFTAINLNDNGRIEYKTQWKEEDKATIEDIRMTYSYVKDLIRKLNAEKNKIQIAVPDDIEFKYAFINTIQKFELPEKFKIDHNDFSEFSRYFFPYVSLVIEPRKRKSKIKKLDKEEVSKYGTYLRYKRKSKFENQARIEQRILYFIRNYQFTDQSLADEIGKQFNITIERAMEEIERVREKYPNVKKSRKILRKLENVPKYKPPGIGIDVQGKTRDKYKIRISGARNKPQLDRIIEFMNVLIYLYIETYLYKKPERQILKQKLKELTNIAKRRNRVNEIVDYERAERSVKQMTMMDKERLAYKPEDGQNQWTRACQNSGDDKKRRPQSYATVDELLAQGFVLNNKTNIYEKEVRFKQNDKMEKTTIRAVGLSGTGDKKTTIYYSCNPKDNGEHMYIGFLSRGNNPYGHCMPCCFKKDPVVSKNKDKRRYFMNCIGQRTSGPRETPRATGEQLYILQDTNKVYEGRYGFLPRDMDVFFNRMLGKTRKIRNNHLHLAKNGYYLKMGTRQFNQPFLSAVSVSLDISVEDIKAKIITTLKNDKKGGIFTALNNGDVRTQFGNIEKFLNFIETSNNLDFNLFNHLLSIPGVMTEHGLNIIVFRKHEVIIKETLEKEQKRHDFTIMCQNTEEIQNIFDPSRTTLLMIREHKSYYPIVLVTKPDVNMKNITTIKTYSYVREKNNIVHHISDFYMRNCNVSLLDETHRQRNTLIAKKLNNILQELGNNDYLPKFQMIDARGKCKYIITHNNTIVSVKPSGAIYDLTITKTFDKKLSPVKDLIVNLQKLKKLSDNRIPIEPVGLYYSSKTSSKATVIAIMTELYDSIPVIESTIDIAWINKQGLVLEDRQLYDKIDDEIRKGYDNYAYDNRMLSVNEVAYHTEAYELFRLEVSEYLSDPEHEPLKGRIIRIIKNRKLTKKEKRIALRKILYRIVDKRLVDTYEQTINQVGGKIDKLVHIISKDPILKRYMVSNNREQCAVHNDRDKCNDNPHCRWAYDDCYFALTQQMAIEFVSRMSEELVENGLKANEILKKGDYFVSDIVDYNRYTHREGQKIVKSTNYSINKELTGIFGEENVPIIGKRRSYRAQLIDYQEINKDNPLKDMGDFYIQNVINNNLSIFRAYVNSYFWNKQSYYDLGSRNLGYYSETQTTLANYFRSLVMDWLMDPENKSIIDNLRQYMDSSSQREQIQSYVMKLSRDITTVTQGIIELAIMNMIHKIPVILYNTNNEILYVFDTGIKYDHNKSKSVPEKYTRGNTAGKYINLIFGFSSGSTIPNFISAMYIK